MAAALRRKPLRAKQKNKNVEWWEYEGLRWECDVIKLYSPSVVEPTMDDTITYNHIDKPYGFMLRRGNQIQPRNKSHYVDYSWANKRSQGYKWGSVGDESAYAVMVVQSVVDQDKKDSIKLAMLSVKLVMRDAIHLLKGKELQNALTLWHNGLDVKLYYLFIMAIRCLVLLLIMMRALSQSFDMKKFLSSYSKGSNPKIAARLYKPLLTDDGRIYTCSGKHLFSFDRNGTVVWIIPLGYVSRPEISPVVDDKGKIFNTEGQLYSLYMRTHHFRWVHDFSSIDKFMTTIPGNNGLLYVIFPRKASVIALDVYSGNILWQQSFGPLGTEQSFPVVDSNGWLSIGSLDGYLYSVSPTGEVKKLLKSTAIDSVIQTSPVLDCSGFAIYVLQTRVIAKSIRDIGNYTYISAMKPASLVLTMLTPATGTVYWTGNYPGTGSALPCHTMSQINAWTCSQAKPKLVNMYTGNEGAILPFIFFQLAVLVLLAFCVRFCFIFWRKRKLQEHGLAMFLDKRRSLHHKRKTLGRMIGKLELRAEEDTNAHENLEQLGEMVNIKKGIERKLSTSYSLGRDTVISQQGSILPLSDGKDRSHSLHSARKEGVTMFNTLSSSESGSSSDDSIDRESRQSWGETEQVDKGKAVVVGSSSSTSYLESENDSGEENVAEEEDAIFN
ncbi:Protein GAMETE EXPRESSED 3 [Dendrobium catenatum]|uniref:Protein GAMETE EXPRESSED 3 n=1 Tax=Dendrobium catenatum TaxID=906689 RepID=A0A2I0WPX0_9ASPA|nr:Protein GAMETE EXPRESSED 3 [Dendrobium catenatum]